MRFVIRLTIPALTSTSLRLLQAMLYQARPAIDPRGMLAGALAAEHETSKTRPGFAP
jgi:hypothetical protein